MSSTCKGCGRPIVWGTGPGGQRIPLDPGAPVYQLVTTSRDEQDREVLWVALMDPAQRRAIGTGVMVSHFATCSAAREFSRGRATPESTSEPGK